MTEKLREPIGKTVQNWPWQIISELRAISLEKKSRENKILPCRTSLMKYQSVKGLLCCERSLSWCLEQVRQLVLGGKYQLNIMTDHKPLLKLHSTSSKNIEGWLPRWSSVLEEFDFKLLCNQEKKNFIADAWTSMKEATPERGPRRPPPFNFDGQEIAAAVEEEEV
jgi:hypothetical protein